MELLARVSKEAPRIRPERRVIRERCGSAKDIQTSIHFICFRATKVYLNLYPTVFLHCSFSHPPALPCSTYCVSPIRILSRCFVGKFVRSSFLRQFSLSFKIGREGRRGEIPSCVSLSTASRSNQLLDIIWSGIVQDLNNNSRLSKM